MLMVLAACHRDKHDHSTTAEEHTCPMHPQIIKSEPGDCPICGMALVSRKKPLHKKDLSVNSLLETNNAVHERTRMITPVYRALEDSVKLPGVIGYDSRHTFVIPSRISGRIEKLYVKYNFQKVEKGQKIMEVYSPDLVNTQRTLIYLLKAEEENSPLIRSSIQKLKLAGLRDFQIKQLMDRKEPFYSVAIFSTQSGYVYEPRVSPTDPPRATSLPNEKEMDIMSEKTKVTAENKTIALREGMYISEGQTLFNIANPDKLWAVFNVTGADINKVEVGRAITIVSPGTTFSYEGKVNFIQPFFGGGENTAQIRVYLRAGERRASVGQQIKGSFLLQKESALCVPASAIVSLGTRQVVFLKKGKSVKPMEVRTGLRSSDWIEVLAGVNRNDTLAANAQFLIDGESFIKTNNQTYEE